jgi:hypothetical protein
MRYESSRWALCLFTLLLWLSAFGTVQAAGSARENVATLVRSLGFGAGIHNFKNFVLRGRDEYYDAAKKDFDIALDSLNQLENSPELTLEDRAAVAVIKGMIDEYDRGLDRVITLRDKGWRLGDVDRSVAVDDTRSIAALAQLREKWEWSDLEQIEYHLGYGMGIHNFKNYLLRQDERYHTLALENFLAVESFLDSLYGNTNLDSAQRAALDQISRVSQSYRNYLALIERFHAQRHPVRKIDLAVKINDRPALEGLAVLSP